MANKNGSQYRTREEYETNSLTRTKPWERMGISRRTWYRRRTTLVPQNMNDTNRLHTCATPVPEKVSNISTCATPVPHLCQQY